MKALIGILLLLGPALADDSLEDINFPLNSSVVVDGFQGLDMLAEVMARNPQLDLEVIGFTDSTGTASYNKRLSDKRAEAVKAYLVSKGVTQSKIVTNGNGISSSYDNASREGRFQNRRVSLVMYETTDGNRQKVTIPRLMSLFFGSSPKMAELTERLAEAEGGNKEILEKLTELNRELKEANNALQQRIGALENANAKMSRDLAEKVDQVTMSVKMGKYVGLSVGGGIDDDGDFVARTRGMYFRQVGERIAVQAQGEFSYYDQLDDGQVDAALIYQKDGWKLATAASYKWVNIPGYDSALLGQAAVIADYRFDTGKIGVFGTFPFADGDVVAEVVDGIYTVETYVNVPEQFGIDFGLSFGDRVDFSGYAATMDTEVADADLSAGLRLDYMVNDMLTWYLEAEQNPSLLTADDSQRYLTGVRLGSWNKARYNVTDHITPVNIPKIHYELLTRLTRTGNTTPIAVAGSSQTDVPEGTVTLDGSGSYDPDGDAITYKWVQTSGTPVVLTGAETAVATFTGVAGQSYVFQLTVRDTFGESSTDTLGVSMEAAAIPEPTIVSFLASPSTIDVGQLSTLSWTVDGADEITITGLGTVGQRGDVPVAPEETTTYTLTATNVTGTVTRDVTVTVIPIVIPDPAVSFFRALPSTIDPGENTTLSWLTLYGDTVTISGIGQVNAQGSLVISPDETTTYTMTVTNEAGQATADVTVTVNQIPAPEISFFSAIPSEVAAGEAGTLSWSVRYADSVVIDGLGQVSSEGSLLVSPTETTTYTLTATNETGTTTATTTITVVIPNRAPVAEAGSDQSILTMGTLVTLDGSKSFDPDGDTITYSWDQISGPPVTLSGADTANPTFTPTERGEYYVFRLSVSDDRGGFDTDTVTVWYIDFR
jgi:hypothetical protein